MRAARTVGAGAGSDRPLLSRVSLLPAQAGSPGRDCRALATEVATREVSACAEPGHASRHLPSVGPRETPHVFNTHVRHWVWRPRPCTGPHRRGSSPAWTLHLLPSPAQAPGHMANHRPPSPQHWHRPPSALSRALPSIVKTQKLDAAAPAPGLHVACHGVGHWCLLTCWRCPHREAGKTGVWCP